MNYIPDKWVVIKITSAQSTYRRVLASWYGGYSESDTWKASSGITTIEKHDDCYEIANVSGSVYTCYKGGYGMTSYTADILKSWKTYSELTIEVLDEADIY